jgi:arabinogalactan endo-1,4-beta-galactosidase
MREGNTVDVVPDAIEDVNLIVDLNGDIVLPSTVNAVMNDNSKQSVAVEWKQMAKVDGYVTGTFGNIDYQAMKDGGVAKYDIVGVAGGMEAHCYVSMVEYNFIQNWSFDDNADGSPWVATPAVKFDELNVEDKVSDSLTGTKHYHFWGSGVVEFNLEQELKGLKAGKYKYSLATMGGDCGTYEAYIYVKINGSIVKKANATFSTYNSWHTSLIEEIIVNEGDTVVVGFYIKTNAGGAWGKIDDALFNSISE